jgi:hexokinase
MGRKSIFAISEIQGVEDQLIAMKQIAEEFHIPSEKLTKISAHLSRQMTEGLEQNDTSVPMLPSWIDSHPTGQETGEYLALDLSGKPFFRGATYGCNLQPCLCKLILIPCFCFG